MINWKELDKFLAPGKVMTLVVMIDGKEIGALSFNVDTLAYKAILETVSNADVIKIADKPAEKPVEKKVETNKPDPKIEAAQKSSDDKANKALIKKEPVDKKDKTKRHPEFNPIPAHDTDNEKPELDQWHNEDDDDNDSDIDKATGEIKEMSESMKNKIASPTFEQIKAFEDEKQPENIAEKHHPSHMENDFNPSKKTIEPVAAATIDDEPETETEIIKTDVKNEKAQVPHQDENQQINFVEEEW